jgi:predicted double-glycine peptidase
VDDAMTTADEYRQLMNNAIAEYRTYRREFERITDAWITRYAREEGYKPQPNFVDAEKNARSRAGKDGNRQHAEALQAFWRWEAVMYGVAAIAEYILTGE